MDDAITPTPSKPLLLLVDDMAENLQVLGQHLADDYELAFAMNGEQALALAVEIQPNLILLDVMMPGMDGYEICRRLKQIPEVRNIPIIFLTARTEIDSLLKGFDVGGVDYVAKPFQAAELRARVKTHVELSRLKSFLCVCSECQKIRNENNDWERLDVYIARHTSTTFSHGYCPDCYARALQAIEAQKPPATPGQ